MVLLARKVDHAPVTTDVLKEWIHLRTINNILVRRRTGVDFIQYVNPAVVYLDEQNAVDERSGVYP